jgi:sulfur dioxygenase
MSDNNLVFFQLFEPQTSTYTYLLGDAKLGSAMLIDPVLEMADRDLGLVKDLGLKLKFTVETHVHADHVTAAGPLRSRTGCKVAVAATAGIASADIQLKNGDRIGEGAYELKVLATPGHTDTCLSLHGAGLFAGTGVVFTGDALMVRGTGRTDFQQGSSRRLYESIHTKLFTLPESTRVYPAHDYNGFTSSTIGLEKKFNPRVGDGKTLAEYEKIMQELKLTPPKRIHEAVPANMRLGEPDMVHILETHEEDGVPVAGPDQIKSKLGRGLTLIDVRRPDEFYGELGHIEGARLVTLGPDLMRFLNEADHGLEIVFICRSGNRSAHATALSRDAGFTKTVNMEGGMVKWNNLGFPVARD